MSWGLRKVSLVAHWNEIHVYTLALAAVAHRKGQHYFNLFLSLPLFFLSLSSLSLSLSTEHQNFVGFDEGLGPVVISLKREKISNKVVHYFSNGQPSNERVSQKYQYRVILRTSEVRNDSSSS